MNIYVSTNIKKVLTILLIPGIFIFTPFATYAAEEASATSTTSTLIEILEPAAEDVLPPEEDHPSIEATTTQEILVPPQSEIIDVVSGPLDTNASSTADTTASTTKPEVITEAVVALEKPVFFVRTKIEPVLPPKRESFKDQLQLRTPTMPEKLPFLPPPFRAPGELVEPIVPPTATTTDEVIEIPVPVEATTTEPVIVLPPTNDQGESSNGTTTDPIPLPDVNPIATTTKEEILSDDDSSEDGGESESDTDGVDVPDIGASTPIVKPEEDIEEVLQESEVSQ